MKPIVRVRFGLLVVVALLTAAFAWSGAQGQFRPPRPPVVRPPVMPRPPRINPPGRGGSTTVWKCRKCGYEYQGAVPPSTCPGCKTQMSNGFANGIPGPGGRVNPNPVPPGTPPGMNPNPPMANPAPPMANPNPPMANPAPPVANANPPAMNMNPPAANVNPQLPPANPVANNSPLPNPLPAASNVANSSDTTSTGSKSWRSVALVVGIIVAGLCALLGGTCLVIYSMKSNAPRPTRRPQRRRRRDEDEEDD